MDKASATREKLLSEARRLWWARGYSNVALREIAQGAGVDVALVSRYFGGKRGLFEATLDGAFDTPPIASERELVDVVARLFAEAPRGGAMPSVLQLIETNARDADVGELIRDAQRSGLQNRLEQVLGDPGRAALFMAVLMGFAMAEKSLRLSGIAPPGSAAFDAQLRHLMHSALAYGR